MQARAQAIGSGIPYRAEPPPWRDREMLCTCLKRQSAYFIWAILASISHRSGPAPAIRSVRTTASSLASCALSVAAFARSWRPAPAATSALAVQKT